jgi:hypothetical protein
MMRKRKRRIASPGLGFLALLALARAGLGGCILAPTASPGELLPGAAETSAEGDAGVASSPTVDEGAILASVSHGAFRDSGAFVCVTHAAYPSEAVTGSTIVEWVSAGAAAEYMAISPDGGAASASLTPGATILREVLDPAGAVEEMTLLVKGPPGYNPAIGDWWWGVTDPEGTPMVEDAGPELGRLSQCYSCHEPRAAEDFLFGVPAADQASTEAGTLQAR